MGTLGSFLGRVGIGSGDARFASAPATAAERRAAYERDGFVAGGPLLAGAALEEARAAFDALFARREAEGSDVRHARVETGKREFWKVYDLHRLDPVFHAIVRHPRLAALLSELTGRPAHRLVLDQVFYKPPRTGGRNEWHRDGPSFPLASPHVGLTSWIALDDATERTGCLSMVPGSHRWEVTGLAVEGDGWGVPGAGDLGTWRGEVVRVVPRPVRAGEVHFHHHLTWHCSGRNGTGRKRRALAVHWAAAEDRYVANRWTRYDGLEDGASLDAVLPVVVAAT